MKKIDIKYFDKIDDEEYLWYFCYGSNINIKRFMIYINGDDDGYAYCYQNAYYILFLHMLRPQFLK